VIGALDLIAGVSVLTVGVVGWRGFRTSAMFAIGTAVAWFVVPAAPLLVLLHRPLLVHTILALPRRRVAAGLRWVVLVVAWVGIALPAAAQPWVSSATAVLCAVLAAVMHVVQRPGLRPDEAAARSALLLLAAGLSLPVLERAVWPEYAELGTPLATYLCAVTLCSATLVRGILIARRHDTDAVIELSGRTPADALVELRRMTLASSHPEESRTLMSAIALLEDNLRLQRQLATQIDEVRDSRARLVGVAIDERRRLERVLADGALRYLGELEACLMAMSGYVRGGPMVTTLLEEVTHTREDLEQLGRGLHPRILAEQGLATALEELSLRSPVRVEVSAPPGRFPERTETTLWYACAEALANAWKHAQATTVRIRVTESDGALRATIRDDGVGGAQLSTGGGLTGLVDRVSAVDGELSLSSTESGTELSVMVPVR
jgi:hypothetical protein